MLLVIYVIFLTVHFSVRIRNLVSSKACEYLGVLSVKGDKIWWLQQTHHSEDWLSSHMANGGAPIGRNPDSWGSRENVVVDIGTTHGLSMGVSGLSCEQSPVPKVWLFFVTRMALMLWVMKWNRNNLCFAQQIQSEISACFMACDMECIPFEDNFN